MLKKLEKWVLFQGKQLREYERKGKRFGKNINVFSQISINIFFFLPSFLLYSVVGSTASTTSSTTSTSTSFSFSSSECGTL